MRIQLRSAACLALVVAVCTAGVAGHGRTGWIPELQTQGVEQNRTDVVHWGADPGSYASWRSHSLRLVPVYTFGTRGAGAGVDLGSYTGRNSVYRSASRLRELYGRDPASTANPRANYLDQTDLALLQRAALAAGRRQIFVVVFDGMDWETTRAAAIHASGRVAYAKGRGKGLHFQDYRADGTTQFGFAVTSPSDDRTAPLPDTQQTRDTGRGLYGGYDAVQGGTAPWKAGSRPSYLIDSGDERNVRHAIPDSSATATSMFAGTKTYNGAINVDPAGSRLRTIAHQMQEAGFAVGLVSDVPISHATPAAAYAHNVSRRDYQDLTRDLVGLPSISHPETPLPGVDVLIGCGHGIERETDPDQGANFVSGNRYLTEADRREIDAAHGGRYVVAARTEGEDGSAALARAAAEAASSGSRLLGFYGTEHGHLPYRGANGEYRPAPAGDGSVEAYSDGDLQENPTLAEMTAAALTVLATNERGFWLMVEPGDVDWANHEANIDASIGAVISGDEAVRTITDWVEAHSDWSQALLIVTADHGHYLVIEDPRGLIRPPD